MDGRMDGGKGRERESIHPQQQHLDLCSPAAAPAGVEEVGVLLRQRGLRNPPPAGVDSDYRVQDANHLLDNLDLLTHSLLPPEGLPHSLLRHLPPHAHR